MPRKRHTPEQIIRRLREAEVEFAKGQTTIDVVRKLGITEQTCYGWRKAYNTFRPHSALGFTGRRHPRRRSGRTRPGFCPLVRSGLT